MNVEFNHGQYTLGIIGLTLLALVLRIIGLNSGLWLDEIYSLVNQFRLSPLELLTTYVGDNQHPLYAFMASIFVSIFGEEPWVIRLPALIFGVATIPALYFLGTRAVSKKEAFLAAALLTVSYHHIWFSQNARGYTAIAFTAILCTDLFLSLLSKKSKKYVWLYAVIAALGCYAHLTMVFIVIAHFIVFIIWFLFSIKDNKRNTNWQRPMAAFFLSGFLTLLFYAPILTQVLDYFINQNSGMESLSTHSWALVEAFKSLSIGLGGGIIVIGGIAMLLIGSASFYRSNKMMLSIFICSIVVTFLVAFLARGTMYPRFFFFLLGFFLLIGVRGVTVTTTYFSSLLFTPKFHQQYGSLFATLTLSFVIAVSAFSMFRNYQYPKMDFDGAIEWVENNAKPEDIIVTAGAAAWPFANYYKTDWPDMQVALDIENLRKDGQQLWIVFTFGRYLKASDPEVYKIVDQECTEAERFHGTLGGGDVVVCRLALKSTRSL